MGHNRIYAAGPTLADCRKDGVTHLRIQCLVLACRHEALIAVSLIRAADNVPVNHIPWRCKNCRQRNISVSAVKEEQPVPVLNLTAIKPYPRRSTFGSIVVNIRV